MSRRVFAKSRIELLLSSALAEFHEWETSSATQIMGNMATRQSSYSKRGISSGERYAEIGQKTFHLIRENGQWRILSLARRPQASVSHVAQELGINANVLSR
jgi:hypothetical protein